MLLYKTPRLTFGFLHQFPLFYQSLASQPESAIGSTTDISAVRTDEVEQMKGDLRSRMRAGDPGKARAGA
jgi:hypothetical protein